VVPGAGDHTVPAGQSLPPGAAVEVDLDPVAGIENDQRGNEIEVEEKESENALPEIEKENHSR